MDCIEKLIKRIERFNKGKINSDTPFKIVKQILVSESDDLEFLEFVIVDYCEMFGFINPDV